MRNASGSSICFWVRSANASPMTCKRSKMIKVLRILEDLQKDAKEVAVDDLKAEAENQGVTDIDRIIDELDKDGMIIHPRPGFLRKL